MGLSSSMLAIPAVLACLLQPAGMPAVSAQETRPGWRTLKCSRYATAWSQAVGRAGMRGLGPDFLARHAAFLASGCQGRHDVCPRSPEEFKLANDMVVLAMDAGTASTFPPFACPR